MRMFRNKTFPASLFLHFVAVLGEKCFSIIKSLILIHTLTLFLRGGHILS